MLVWRSEKEKMRLNEAGKMVDFWWQEIPNKFKNIQLDEFTVMPNHFHGIFWILNSCCRGNPCGCPNEGRAGARPAPTNTKTVGNIAGAFKSLMPALLDYFGACVMLKTQ